MTGRPPHHRRAGVRVLPLAALLAVCLAVSGCPARNGDVDRPTGSRPVAATIAKEKALMIPPGTTLAFVKYVKDHPELVRRIPDEPGPSVPIPLLHVPGPDGDCPLAMTFVYYVVRPKDLSQNIYRVSAPDVQVIVDYQTKKVLKFKDLSPGDLNVRWDPALPLGTYQAPADLTMDRFRAWQETFYGIYDRLLPAFAAQRTTFTDDERKEIRAFNDLLIKLVHPPALPLVHGLNPDFFSWLAQAAPAQPQ